MKVEMRNLMKVETDLPRSKLAESTLNNTCPMLCSERQHVWYSTLMAYCMAVPFHCNHGSKINVIRFSGTFETCTKVYAAYRCGDASVVLELTSVEKKNESEQSLFDQSRE